MAYGAGVQIADNPAAGGDEEKRQQRMNHADHGATAMRRPIVKATMKCSPQVSPTPAGWAVNSRRNIRSTPKFHSAGGPVFFRARSAL
jgi:hypothetical protein